MIDTLLTNVDQSIYIYIVGFKPSGLDFYIIAKNKKKGECNQHMIS